MYAIVTARVRDLGRGNCCLRNTGAECHVTALQMEPKRLPDALPLDDHVAGM